MSDLHEGERFWLRFPETMKKALIDSWLYDLITEPIPEQVATGDVQAEAAAPGKAPPAPPLRSASKEKVLEWLDGWGPHATIPREAARLIRQRQRRPESSSSTLNALAGEILEINRANGWDVMTPDRYSAAMSGGDDYAIAKVATVVALIHSEVSEALEALRNCDRANLAEEVADVVIRCLDFAAGAGIDLDAAVAAKLERNRGRGYRHGGKAV